MRIVFCTCDSPTFTGGPNSWLRRLLLDLKDAGLDIQVIFLIGGGSPNECPTYQMLVENDICCLSFPIISSTEQKIHWILSVLSENPPDIFVPNMLVAPFYASRWVKEAGIPTIGVLHSDDDFHRGVLDEFVFGHAAYRFSALVCVSDFLKQYVSNLGNTTTEILQIPYGVPVPVRQAHPPDERLKLIYVGRLEEEQKRISEVTLGLCQVVKQVTSTEVIIYGEGSARPQIEQILEEQAKGLPIKLGGMVRNDQIQDVMIDAHALVLLSDYEGLPIALMEAMACGLVPICLSMRSGIPELVENGVTGLLVNDRNDSLIEAVQHLQEQPELWQRLSRAAHAKIESSYSQSVCAEKWLSLFHSLYQRSNNKESIRHPNWLRLPPTHPSFLREDFRRLKRLTQTVNRRLTYPLKAMKKAAKKMIF